MSNNRSSYHYSQNFTTESGYTFSGLDINYKTWGTLNKDKSNAVLIFHALTGNAEADEWFSGFFDESSWIDLEHHFVICANALGSCYGTTGPISTNPDTDHIYSGNFPYITIRDMVRVNQILLDHLNITKLEAVVGGSMGGMEALEMAIMDKRVASAILIGMGKAHSPWAIGISHTQRKAIHNDPKWRDGYYQLDDPPTDGLATARMIAMLSYRSPENYEDKFGRDLQSGDESLFQVESYLNHQGNKLVNRFDANTYDRLSRAMDTHDVSRERGSFQQVLSAITIPIMVMGIDSDILYPIEEQKELADMLPRGYYTQMTSRYGHDAFLLEFEQMNRLINEFYKSTEVQKNII